jgi:hypothetical protein
MEVFKFCANCGSNTEESEIFCSNCGKSLKGINKKNNLKNGIMVRFVRKAFRSYFEVILWINLIIFTVSGWNTGKTIKEIIELVMRELIGNRRFSAGGYPFFGAFLGLLVGLLVNIIVGGLIATITNMDDKIEDINKDIKFLIK